MKKFEIMFTNNEEDFADNYSKGLEEGKFATKNEELFWVMYMTIRDNPPAMWYWILVDGKQIISGAIDPDDPEIIEESLAIPDWVKEQL